MNIIYIILPFALIIAVGVLIGFLWAARSGQFDDLETPSRRILIDDVPIREGENAEDTGESKPRPPKA